MFNVLPIKEALARASADHYPVREDSSPVLCNECRKYWPCGPYYRANRMLFDAEYDA